MQDYTLFDVLQPWVILVCLLVPLMYAERWVHQHMFGIGYLISQDKVAATRLFYVIFSPGIFIHEFIQYLVAGALNVPTKKVTGWPEEQENGILRLDFIVVEQEETDAFRAALVAAAPFFVMSILIWYISTQILDFTSLTSALGTGDIQLIWAAIGDLIGKSDFIIWIFLLFAIANSMIPKREELRGIPLILGVGVVIMLGMLILGLDSVLLETFGGPVADTMNLINIAVASVLILDVVMILFLGLIEDSLERWRGYKMDYSAGSDVEMSASKSRRKKKRMPGSDEPLKKGDLLPTIYNLDLPLPSPDDRLPAARPVTASSVGSRPSSLGTRAPAPRPATTSPAAESSLPSRQSVLQRGTIAHEDDPAASARPSAPAFGSRPRPERQTGSQRPVASQRPSPSQRPAQGSSRPPQQPKPSERPATSGSPFQRSESGERPAGQRPPFERPAAPSGERPATSGSPFQRSESGERPTGQRPPFERPAAPSSERPATSGSPFQRSESGERPAGQRPPFERPTAPSSERPAQPTGAVQRPNFAPRPSSTFSPKPRISQPSADDDTEKDDEPIVFGDIQDDDDDLVFDDIRDEDE